jgi:hypothetical protein
MIILKDLFEKFHNLLIDINHLLIFQISVVSSYIELVSVVDRLIFGPYIWAILVASKFRLILPLTIEKVTSKNFQNVSLPQQAEVFLLFLEAATHIQFNVLDYVSSAGLDQIFEVRFLSKKISLSV